MRIYDRKGKLEIPASPKKKVNKNQQPILVKECFCPKGHNLVDKRVWFNGCEGIFLKARNDKQEGIIGLSPVYGEKCRIAMDIDLVSGEIYELLCPHCDTALPAFSSCGCGANIVSLFLSEKSDFSNCIGICTRVDCTNATVQSQGDLLHLTAINSSGWKSGMRRNCRNLRILRDES